MNVKLFIASAAAAAAFLPSTWAAPSKADSAPPPITVAFEKPETFTDVKDSYHGSEKGRDSLLSALKKHLEKRGQRFLAPGQTLAITVTDLDMAGDFEPWRGPAYDDVRIVKDLYPPRIKLSFQLSDSSGRVLSSGNRELTDLSFQMSVSVNMSDPLRYEKDMLDSWLRREVRMFASVNY